MWEIYEHKKIDEQLKSIPLEILKKYETWKYIVAISGPDGLKLIRGFCDEPFPEWNGHRSSRLSLQYRVIYKAKKAKTLVKAMKITPHDYRK